MTQYRIYVLDAQDRIAAVLEQPFRSERDALATAEALRADHYAAELWNGENLVARMGGALVLGWAA